MELTTFELIASLGGFATFILGIIWGLVKYILSNAEARINEELSKLETDSDERQKLLLNKIESTNLLIHKQNNEVQKLTYYYEELQSMKAETNTILKEMKEILHKHDIELIRLQK